jgi:multiple sugar transport system substrate-binding protein
MIKLKGITWNHPRGYEPLRAVAALWQIETGIEVTWDVRTLKEFGDFPIEKLVTIYDFILIDHPYMGEAAANKLLVPLDSCLNKSFMQFQGAQSVGPSFESYSFDGHWWALPVDAAAQVAAYRKDITVAINWELPGDIMRLNEAASQLPAAYKIGIPLCATDIWCVFLSLCAKYYGDKVFTENGIDVATGVWALEHLRLWKVFLHKGSFSMNPIQMLEYMSVNDDIVYIPFTFGYTNYARKGWRKKRVHFCNVPKYQKEEKSSLLGGTGLAIAAQTKQLNACIAFTKFILSADIQKGIYYKNGGQPAHLDAWLDKENNEDCSGFFSDTMDTITRAYVRPRIKGFNRFQESAADIIHAAVQHSNEGIKIIQQLNTLYQSHCQ